MGFSVAACSGVFAALASVFSKVALEDGGILIRATICPWIQEDYCDTASTLIHILCLYFSRYFYAPINVFPTIPLGIIWGYGGDLMSNARQLGKLSMLLRIKCSTNKMLTV